jgi:FkbM family methyltransferase
MQHFARIATVADYRNCRYGPMFGFASDPVIGRALKLYGEWSEHEIDVLSRFIRDDTIALDIGANIGNHTLAFAKRHPKAEIWGFEPRPLVSSLAWANCARNGVRNALIVSAACGVAPGAILLAPPLEGEGNVGAFSLRQISIGEQPAAAAPLMSRIEVVALDDYDYARPISLLKIDVEGMEFDVLAGARETLAAHRPAVFFETLDAPSAAEPCDLLSRLGYRLFWLETHQFNRLNHRGHEENIWWRTEMGVLALPEGCETALDLPPVLGSAEALPFREDARAGVEVAGYRKRGRRARVGG